MASSSRFDASAKMAIIFSSSDPVPISFPLDSDGVAHVSSLRLSLRFQISQENMFLDEEVYDAVSGAVIDTISRSPVSDGSFKQWLLHAGRYRVYGVKTSVMPASTEVVTPHPSSTSSAQVTPVTRVKIENVDMIITILSDDSDGNSPTIALPGSSPLVDRVRSNSSQIPSSSASLPSVN